MAKLLSTEAEVKYPQHEVFFVFPRAGGASTYIDVTGLKYTNTLSDVGSMSCTIALHDTILPTLRRYGLEEGNTHIYILRDRKIVWGGILYTWDGSQDNTINVTGRTFEYMLSRVLNLQDKFFEDTDQMDIARWLITANGVDTSLGLELAPTTSPRRRQRTFNSFDFDNVYNELSKLSRLIDGFDYEIVSSFTIFGDVQRRLEFSYPSFWDTMPVEPVLLTYPGIVSSYNFTKDVTARADRVWALGDGEGIDMAMAYQVSGERGKQGTYPLDTVKKYSTVVNQETLQLHADADILDLTREYSDFSLSVVIPEQGVNYWLVDALKPGTWVNTSIEHPLADNGKIELTLGLTEVTTTVSDVGGIITLDLGVTIPSNEEVGT